MNDPLSNRLHQEGVSSSPEFSAELHERTMRRLHQNRLRESVRIVPFERWRIALACAAAVLMAAGVWWTYGSNPSVAPVAIGPKSPAPVVIALRTLEPDDIIRGADPITEALSGVGAAPLEDIARDAKSVASYFMRQLPTFTPAPQNNRQL